MDDKLQLLPGAELNAEVAKAFGFAVIWLDGPFGRCPYIWDESAQRTATGWTNCSLLGASAIKGKNEAGEMIEIFGRIVPGYSTAGDGMLDAVRLMRDHGYESSISGAGTLYQATFTHVGSVMSSEAHTAYAETMPHAVSMAVISALSKA